MGRRIPTLRMIYLKAASSFAQCLHPDNCGDGWNEYDCVICMAKARQRHEKDKRNGRKEIRTTDQNSTTTEG